MRAGSECPKCGGQMLPDEEDKRDLNCLQCGHMVYTEVAEDDGDRRNLTDNRQAETPFVEYKRALSPEDYQRMMKEIGLNPDDF